MQTLWTRSEFEKRKAAGRILPLAQINHYERLSAMLGDTYERKRQMLEDADRAKAIADANLDYRRFQEPRFREPTDQMAGYSLAYTTSYALAYKRQVQGRHA